MKELQEHIHKQLYFFTDRTLYPEYDPSMRQYTQEAQELQSYMSTELGFNYHFDKRGLLIFPWDKRWLRGEEYAFILRHYKTYNALAGFSVNDKKQDETVYETPKSKTCSI